MKELIKQGIPVYWTSTYYTVILKGDDYYIKAHNGSMTYFEYDAADLFVIIEGKKFTPSLNDSIVHKFSETHEIMYHEFDDIHTVIVVNGPTLTHLETEVNTLDGAISIVESYINHTQKVLIALRTLKSATEELNHLWNNKPEMTGVLLENEYPFALSFDEQTEAINHWYNSNNY